MAVIETGRACAQDLRRQYRYECIAVIADRQMERSRIGGQMKCRIIDICMCESGTDQEQGDVRCAASIQGTRMRRAVCQRDDARVRSSGDFETSEPQLSVIWHVTVRATRGAGSEIRLRAFIRAGQKPNKARGGSGGRV